jgi:hypothetical protein
MFTYEAPELFCEACLKHVGAKLAAAMRSPAYQPFAFETHVEQQVGDFVLKANLVIYDDHTIYDMWAEALGSTWAHAGVHFSHTNGQTRYRWVQVCHSDNENATLYLAIMG